MVSLEMKNHYLSKISDSPKLSAFNNMLKSKIVLPPSDSEISEAEEIYYGIISAIQTNNKSAFEKYYGKKNKSNPSKESPAPFVNDDFLIFSVILGVSKFGIDKSWIKRIVSIRSKNTITTTLDNLLEGNFYSTSNLPEVVLMFLEHINQSLITNELLNSTFKKINENTTLYDSKSDFQILCAIHAYDLIILLKVAPEGSEIQQLQIFNSKFVKRTKVLSRCLQTVLWIGLFYGLLQLPLYSPETIALIEDYGYIFTIIGVLGLTILGDHIDYFKRKSHETTMRIFGYPQGLMNNKKQIDDNNS